MTMFGSAIRLLRRPPRPCPRAAPGPFWLRAAVFCALMPGVAALAQPAPPMPGRDPARGQPLQQDPGDWWGDVHRWTGSDATRPAAPRTPRASPQAAPTRPAGAPMGEGGTVVTSATSRANIRREPSLSAPVLRAMPQSSTLRVFGEAPGGWFHVGEAEPFGWIHASALQR